VVIRTTRGGGREIGCSLLPVSSPHAGPNTGFTRLKYPPAVGIHGGPGDGLSSFAAPASSVVRCLVRFQTVTSWPALTTVTLEPGEGLDLLLEWGGRPEPPGEREAVAG
jgi:hypothetical protein